MPALLRPPDFSLWPEAAQLDLRSDVSDRGAERTTYAQCEFFAC